VLSPASERLLGGRYQLVDLLGTGGMADVHRAWDTRLRRFVAVKRFRFNPDDRTSRRVTNEIQALARLSHPGLVSVFDAGVSGDTPFVVLQLVDGHTLRDEIVCGPVPVAEVRRLGALLADALDHVHTGGVVHRDIKPSNILLSVDGTPYLADFGLATLAGATRFTATGQLVGTAAYLAPEQVRGTEVTNAADIYALGLVLLECLTGRVEYDGNEIESAVARLHRPPAVPDDLPADLGRLLTLMTSLTPRRRPKAAECAALLRGDTPTDRFEGAEPPQSRRRLFAVGGAGVGAVAAGVIWASLSVGTPTPATSEPVVPPASSPSSAVIPPPSAVTTVVTRTSVVGAPVRPADQPVQPQQQQQQQQQPPGKAKNDKPKHGNHGPGEDG
jgi:serine/threonine protein kinase